MAYTIISQNNNTTTLTDGVNTITVPSRVNLTSGNFTIVEVNNNMATLEDGDGNVYRDIPCVATLVDAGGGGSAVDSVNGKTGTVVLDAKDVHAVPQYTTMPTADSTNVGEIAQFAGTTDATYTNGYIYENVATTTSSSATASQTTGSSLSDVAVVLATFETQITTSGSYAFTSDGTNWSYDGNTVDLTDYGITYTGTPVADDVITVVYTESSTTYAWTRIDVQPSPNPLPSQTGQSGKFLTTDGTDASWAAVNALQNTATGPNSLTILGTASAYSNCVNIGNQSEASAGASVAIGEEAQAYNNDGSVVVGYNSRAWGGYGVAIGWQAESGASKAIQLGNGTNSDANTLKVGNANGNYEIMSADGTIPTARLTNAINKYSSMPTAGADYLGQIAQFTGTTDATYTHGYIYECVSDGATPPTYSWTAVSVQAGGGSSLPSQTGNSGKFLTTDGTDASWGTTIGDRLDLVRYSGNSEFVRMYYNTTVMTQFQMFDTGSAPVFAFYWKSSSSNQQRGLSFQATNIYPNQNDQSLGNITNKWDNIYTTKLNNGADIDIPTTGGTMVVATPPSADGTYVLKATVSSGVVTVAWVAE